MHFGLPCGSASTFRLLPMRLFFLLLRTSLALGLLVWVIRRLQWEEIAGFDWAGISLGWLGLAFLLGGLSLLGWAGRWWWFVRVYGLRVPFRELLRLTMFADFFNLYFLGPLGADGVRLPSIAQPGDSVIIVNDTGSTIKVWPPTRSAAIGVPGTSFGSAVAGASYAHTTYAVVRYTCYGGGLWMVNKSA